MDYKKDITEKQGINFTSKNYWRKEILMDYIASDAERKETKFISENRESKKENKETFILHDFRKLPKRSEKKTDCLPRNKWSTWNRHLKSFIDQDSKIDKIKRKKVEKALQEHEKERER